MSNCIAFKQSGTRCTNHGKYEFEGRYCGIHFEKKKRDDPAYRTRYNAQVVLRAQANNAALEQRQAELDSANERAQQLQERKIRRNTKIINDAHLFSPDMIIAYARNLLNMWNTTLVPSLEFAKAYVLLRYRTSTNDGFPNLMRSVTRIVRQGNGHHHIHARYMDVPVEERRQAFESLQLALNMYGEFTETDIFDLMPANDPYRHIIRTNIANIEARRLAVIAREAELAQLNHNLAHNPVVFQRDPEGSINLRAFANDQQSVHRSSVQSATHRAVLSILERPLSDSQDTLAEIIEYFNHPSHIHWYGDRMCERAITELTNDYYNCEAFSVKYGDVLDHVWSFIKLHEHKIELVIRLAQEVCEGIRQCTNGKMARLINVLQGYDDTLEVEAPKELFQGRIALLMDRPIEERETQARTLFAEFNIPAEQHMNWLQPLLEV